MYELKSDADSESAGEIYRNFVMCAVDFLMQQRGTGKINADRMKKIVIPATVTKIEDGNFTSTTGKEEDFPVIYGFAGSEAERYANDDTGWFNDFKIKFINI